MKISQTIRNLLRNCSYVGFLLIATVQIAVCAENGGPQKQLILLGDSEIKNALVGNKLLVVDNNTGFSEDFWPDETWVTRKTGAFLKTRIGKWRIDGKQICTLVMGDVGPPPLGSIPTPGQVPGFVATSGQQELCREVGRDKASGHIVMLDPFDTQQARMSYSSSPLDPRTELKVR